MLAKKLKIQNLKRQREFIEEQLEYMLSNPNEDGNATYRYVGHLLPEVISHFEKEGFTITSIRSDSVISRTEGKTLYLFTISDDVALNDDERTEAEAVEIGNNDDDESTAPLFNDLLTGLVGDSSRGLKFGDTHHFPFQQNGKYEMKKNQQDY